MFKCNKLIAAIVASVMTLYRTSRPRCIVKTCGSCGRVYTRQQWMRAAFVGIQAWPDSEKLELRTCVHCHSTMAVSLLG